MPNLADFNLGWRVDGNINIPVYPPTNIGGWGIEFTVLQHFGGISGLITKSCASGFNGSGITIINSGQGIFQVSIYANDTSGMGQGAYPYVVQRTDSGFRTELSAGYLLLGINQGAN